MLSANAKYMSTRVQLEMAKRAIGRPDLGLACQARLENQPEPFKPAGLFFCLSPPATGLNRPGLPSKHEKGGPNNGLNGSVSTILYKKRVWRV
jgi:hypothetical protein